MRYYIFAFRSRNQSMRFYEMLRNEGIYSKLISTPREISVGCGLSVQISENLLDYAKRTFYSANFDTFLGLFYSDNRGCIRVRI